MRLLQSHDSADREQGASSLQILLSLNRLDPKQLDAAIPALAVALRDPEATVREKSMMALFHVIFDAGFRTKTLPPRLDAIVPGLMEATLDTTHAVHRNASLSLANIYFTFSSDWKAKAPLPKDLDRFLEVLCQVLEDPDPETPEWAFQVLRETASRMDRPAPPELVKALESNDRKTRKRAAEAIGRFPRGIDQVLPAFFRAIESEDQPEYRRA